MQNPRQEVNDLCEKYYLDIYKYCAARVDISCAEDMTNDVFALFCKKWQSLENGNYKSWLYETAQNLIKNHYKKQRRRAEKEIYIDEAMAEELSYEENFENIGEDEIEKYSDEIINSLPERERQLYDLKYVEKLSISQMSEKLSVSEGALEKRLYRLKQKIAGKIDKKLN
jgi:RNA polymerase sigma-70 factor (ECF subfamily)